MANISSYNQLSSWNEDDDLLFVQQPDAPKKAHPSQMKEYILGGLDVSSVGGTGKYISAISEADGKISATAETMDTAPTEGGTKAVTSGGIKTAIDDSVSLKTVTGNPITLTDAANANAEELSMTIEPVQSGSGDPSPTNVRPISGISEAVATRTGKNLFDKTNYLDKTYIDSTTGELIVEQNAGWVTTPLIHINGVSSLTMQGNKVLAQNAVRYRVLDYDKNIISVVSLTLREVGETNTFSNLNGFYFQMCFRNENGALDACQIEEGPTPTAYEPYTGATATITFGQTVYGGSVNFKTGEVTVTHGIVDLGMLTWGREGFTNGNWRFSARMPINYKTPTRAQDYGICSNYSYSRSPITGTTGVGISANPNDPTIFIMDMTYTDAAAFKTAMSGVQLCYELATPTTLTLTPAELELLKGNNTITANGAEISIEYYPDNAIGALAGRVDDKADITYVDNAVDGKVEIQNNAGFHNSIYRGKSLGSEVTAEQYAAIEAGTFDDMYIGDYWTIGGVNYRIAHFNYWLHSGDTECTTPHVVIVPDTNLYTAKMNATPVTTGAYVGSAMYTTNLAQAKTTINNAFGASHILNHREFLANAMKAATDPTYESAGGWYDSTVEIMSERMVYGADVFHNIEVNGSIPVNYTIDKSQLALFVLDPSCICNRADWWLRSAVSAERFACVHSAGGADTSAANYALGVRPAFGIKA